MSLNADLIRERCMEIEESLERLGQIARCKKEEFLNSPDLKDIACYRLLIAIEAALSLCYHVSAKKLKKVPEDYAECFAILGQAGIIPIDLSFNLQNMARFRNLLVHMYWKIDYEKVYKIIQEDVHMLRNFANYITNLL
ncbi:MAG: type VII toxin-antitoxin system HepT family RNase toxin [Thermodesulfobacteriota bacterium]